MLNIDFFAAIKLQAAKLEVLYNEALRQRALDILVVAIGSNYSANKSIVDRTLKIHGAYTEGFYAKERNQLKEALWHTKKE